MKKRFINDEQNQLIRNNWQLEEIIALFNLPFNDLLFKAHSIHREFFDPNKIETCQLLSIKNGACPEDCKYCTQSAHYKTEVKKYQLLDREEIKNKALEAKEKGALRFCMGAAWRNLHDRDIPEICEIIKEVKGIGLETCMTLGMLTEDQAKALKDAGLDFYNHNIDTSKEYYDKIITTRTFEDRIETLGNIRKAGINVCSGGILGMGEEISDRASMLETLANLEKHPESVPINLLTQVQGTPLYGAKRPDNFEVIRTIAVARILMPKSFIRMSCGRDTMSEETQSLCFFAGANSIFIGEVLLNVPNPRIQQDKELFAKLGLKVYQKEDKVEYAELV